MGNSEDSIHLPACFREVAEGTHMDVVSQAQDKIQEGFRATALYPPVTSPHKSNSNLINYGFKTERKVDVDNQTNIIYYTFKNCIGLNSKIQL